MTNNILINPLLQNKCIIDYSHLAQPLIENKIFV